MNPNETDRIESKSINSEYALNSRVSLYRIYSFKILNQKLAFYELFI
jgi:hypothetical protein